MNIGIYSGSFDPIHTGHAMVANYCSQWESLDEVWLMVSPQNPLKEGMRPTPAETRLEMAGLVAGMCSGVRASDYELSLPLPSYTYVTLCRLREDYPQHKFTLIIGSDNWMYFGRWRDAHKIIREFGLLIYPRPGFPLPDTPPEGVGIIGNAPTAQISSTFVREAVRNGGNVNFFVPAVVADYIREKGLYK